MALEAIIAVVRESLGREQQVKKHYRYLDEEKRVARMRADLQSGDRTEWLEAILETEQIMDCPSDDCNLEVR